MGSICLSKQTRAWAIEPDSCLNEGNQVWFTQHTFRCPSKRVSARFKLERGLMSRLVGNLHGCSLDCGSGSCTTAVQHAEVLSRSGFLTHFFPVFHLFHFRIHSTRCTRWHNSRECLNDKKKSVGPFTQIEKRMCRNEGFCVGKLMLDVIADGQVSSVCLRLEHGWV